MNTVAKNVASLVVGDAVDLRTCPYLRTHPSADFEFARVAHVEQETPDCVVVGYEGIDHIGYPRDTVLHVGVSEDTDPVVNVRTLDKPKNWTKWNITLCLTDPWGTLNEYKEDSPALTALKNDTVLYQRLRSQMWQQSTFIVRKEGAYGVLFEVEYASLESENEQSGHGPEFYATLKPRSQVVKQLLEGLKPLAERFPGVELVVPQEIVIIEHRPAVWAFVPDGVLTDAQRNELGTALHSLIKY